MAFVRFATPADYVETEFAGKTMYRISWEDRFCPGNPTSDPIAGANEYNAYVSADHGINDPVAAFNAGLRWVLSSDTPAAQKVAADLVAAVESGVPMPLPANTEEMCQDEIEVRTAAAFLNDALPALTQNARTHLKIKGSWKTHG